MTLSTLELVAAAAIVAAIWPLMHVKASPTAGTAGVEGERAGTQRPED